MRFDLNAASPTAQQGQVRLQGAEDAVRRGRAEQDLLDDGLQAAQSTSVVTSDFDTSRPRQDAT